MLTHSAAEIRILCLTKVVDFFSTCVSKMKNEMEIQQDAVTLWLEKNQTRDNPHDTKPNIIKACAQWYG